MKDSCGSEGQDITYEYEFLTYITLVYCCTKSLYFIVFPISLYIAKVSDT